MAIALKSSAGLSPADRTLSFMDGSVYSPDGTQITAPSVNAKAGLPSLTGTQVPPPPVQGGGSVANTSQDPMTIFNTNLFQMLQDAQKTQNSPALLNERNRLQLLQTQNSMGSASDLGLNGLNPADALAARQNASNLYNPEIKSLTDRVQASVQAVSAFKDSLDAAAKYGQQYADSIKPDQATIAAAQAMLEAGHNPSTAVLDKVSKYIDWGKVAAADQAIKNKNKTGSSDNTTFKFTSGDVGQLLAAGFNQADISKIQSDIGKYGIDKVTEGMSDTQKQAIKSVVGGQTPAQQAATAKASEKFLSPQWFWQNFDRQQLIDAASADGMTKKISGGLLDMGIGAKSEGDPDAYINSMMAKIERDRTAGMNDQDIYNKYFK